VFDKGKPVKGLKKENFKLFENDKEKDIRVFSETRKKVTEPDDASPSGAGEYVKRPSRLFLLNFNIGDHRIDIKEAVKPFFKKILQPGDRLIVTSNSFFLNDRVVIDPEVERKKVEHILEVEKVKAHWRYSWMTYEVGNAFKGASDIRSATARDQEPNTAAAYEFLREEYLKFLKDYKASITMMNEGKFLRLARYLQEQDIEKWVFNFYQPAYFLAMGAGFDFEVDQELAVPTEVVHRNLKKIFLNSGASFHTILLGTELKKYALSRGIKYAPLVSSVETILRDLTRLTGGAFTHSNKSKRFFRKLESTEDVYYTLVYAPAEPNETKRAKIIVTVNNDDFKLVYDNQERKKRFEKVLEKLEKRDPQVTLGNIYVANGMLNFPVSNFKMKADNNKVGGKLRVRITIFNKEAQTLLLDRQKELEAQGENLDVRVALNELKPGNYRIFVEVTDLVTSKNDLGLTEVDFKGMDS
jgi:hypothetical protein